MFLWAITGDVGWDTGMEEKLVSLYTKEKSFSLYQNKSKGMYKLLEIINEFVKAIRYNDNIYIWLYFSALTITKNETKKRKFLQGHQQNYKYLGIKWVKFV